MSPEARQAIEEDREHLQTLADSELPAAWVAESLLESADTAGAVEVTVDG